jgi:CheY-like chemotaxis protein
MMNNPYGSGNGPAANPDGPGLRVLVVEDDVETALGMSRLLVTSGHEVQVAPDGASAVRAAQSKPPDVVLLDIGLPGMDGYQVAEQLYDEATMKRPLVIALTGLDKDDDRRRSAAAGIDLHLVKPANPDALRKLLRRFQQVIG